MRRLIGLGIALLAIAPTLAATQAPTGFGNASNGAVSESTHVADRAVFDEVETVDDGLGPLYNAQACRECHQNPISGGGEPDHRAARRSPRLATAASSNPDIPIGRRHRGGARAARS